MKTNYLLTLCFLMIFTIGCTTAGPKFIEIKYLGKAKASMNENVGISFFLDKRGDLKKGYLGKRTLNSGSEEEYFVKGLNIAVTITDAFKSHFNKSGYNCKKINHFEPNVNALKNFKGNYKYIIGGDIIEFEFFASKDFTTSMVLDIKLIVFLGNIEKGKLTKIPVTLNLKRKDLKFSEKSIENFINKSLTEVILKTITSENLE